MIGKISVKSVKFADFMSQETICFSAIVYEDGKRIGTAENSGHGGNTFIYLDKQGRDYSEVSKIEEAVDELVYAIDAEKQVTKIRKQLERACVKHICVGWINESGASYTMQGFVPSHPLTEIAKTAQGLSVIQKLYDRLKSELKDGETILNTNLEALGVTI